MASNGNQAYYDDVLELEYPRVVVMMFCASSNETAESE